MSQIKPSTVAYFDTADRTLSVVTGTGRTTFKRAYRGSGDPEGWVRRTVGTRYTIDGEREEYPYGFSFPVTYRR